MAATVSCTGTEKRRKAMNKAIKAPQMLMPYIEHLKLDVLNSTKRNFSQAIDGPTKIRGVIDSTSS